MNLSQAVYKLIDYLKDKNILILGFGREGRSTYSLIRRYLPEKHIGIADTRTIKIENDPYVKTYFGDNYLDSLKYYDFCIKSPGIPFKGIKIPKECEISCQLDLFLRFSNSFKIGITGTKGKTTTATLVYRFLTQAGLEASLIGNIGVPVFESFSIEKESIAVIEMSSHQLQYTSSSPQIAVLTNVYEEHLDHYDEGFIGYIKAKLNIVKHQNEDDVFIYNADQGISDFIDVSLIKSKKEPISIKTDDEFLLSLENLSPYLKGRHNLQDIYFAAAVARHFSIKNEDIVGAIKNYKGIEHRMEYVGRYFDIDFYNDSIATIPKAVIFAIDALSNVGSLIIGGHDRGLNYMSFAKELAKKDVKNIICLPQTGHSIGKMIEEEKTKANVFYADDLPEAVKIAFKYSPKNSACLLSPAASSYNVYRDFEEKGQHFKHLVKEFGEKDRQ